MTLPDATADADPREPSLWRSRRLWSLRDMINYQIFGLCHLLRQLLMEEQEMNNRVAVHDYVSHTPPAPANEFSQGMFAGLPGPPAPLLISDQDRERIRGWLGFTRRQCNQLGLEAARHRVDLFEIQLRSPMTGAEFVSQTRTLREAIEGEINFRYFHHYAPAKAAVLLRFETDWAEANKQFPAAKPDAFSAVDCWAIGQNTAAVFHLMRVAEYGLRALARERRVKLPKNRPLEWGEWQTVITEISKKADIIATRRAGKARDSALEFYRGALGEFQAFKDAYRNNVMHTRRSYDEYEAQSAMLHVRDFMRRLSAKIGERPKAIRWGKM